MTPHGWRSASCALLAVGIAGAAQPCLAATDARERQLAAACASCHRPDGHDTALPPIAGLGEERIVQLMLAYRSGERSSQIMHVVAGALSREEIQSVAHYLASTPPVVAR